MRRAIKYIGASFAALILLGAVSIVVAVKLNTDHTLIARLLSRVTSGKLVVHRLTGDLTSSPRFGTVEIHDARGTWAVVHDLRIDWSPWQLVHRDALLERFSAARIDVLRRPVLASGGKSSWYGFRVDIDTLAVGRLDLAPSLIGVAAALRLSGNLHLAGPDAGKAGLALERLDAAGAYAADADFSPARIDASLSAKEPPRGLLAQMAHVPDIGRLAADVRIAGIRSAEATSLAVQAGKLLARAEGKIDLEHRALDLQVTASAPAMAPRPDLSWRSVALDARVHGPFAAPDAAGKLRVADLAAAGAAIGTLDADVDGNAGRVALRARAENVRVPGPNPDVLAAAPVLLTADARLNATERPVTFALAHPLLTAKGQADTAGPIRGSVAVQIPALAPLARVAALDLRGRAAFDATFAVSGAATRIDLDGTVAVTGGQQQAVALIGRDGQIGLGASLRGDTVALSRLRVAGHAIDLAASGQIGLASETLDLGWKATLNDLRAAVPTLTGRLAAEGRLHGKRTNLSLTASAAGDLGGQGVPPGPVKFAVALSGLPAAPAGRLTARGVLDRAPLDLAVGLNRSASGIIRLAIERAAWKSARAAGTLTLAPPATLPEGRIVVRIGRLQDVQPFVGAPIGGTVDATAELAGARARVTARMRELRLPGAGDIAAAEFDGSVAGLPAHPVVDARLTATGGRGSLVGDARIAVRGPAERLAVQIAAKSALAGAPAEIASTGVVDATARTATLGTLQAEWKGAALHLLAPARLDFGPAKFVRHLRIGVNRAVLAADGRIAPTLDLHLAATNVTPDLARMFDLGLRAEGRLSAEARLTGTLAHPLGSAHLAAHGLRMASGPGRALPAADLSATAALNGRTARIDAQVTAGAATRLAVAGSVPLAPAGPLDLRSSGSVDLAMLNPLTAADGVVMRGRLALHAGIAGTLHAPSLAGAMQLTGGDVEDFAQGAHLADIRADIQGEGNTLRLAQFAARAGKGLVHGTGTIGVLAPGIPVALNVTMTDAKPLASNLLTATLDANVALTGKVEGQLRAAGTIRIRQAAINVPEHMPQSVAVLPVRVAGKPLPPPPPPGPDLALALDLSAPRRIYVRGRGIDAELGGRLQLGGTAKHPQPTGAFQMIRGEYSVAGTTLTFTEGNITFGGRGNVAGGSRIDPALHFVATSSNANVTATLTVGGFASDPKITLASVPELPQDEVLAQLLFGQSVKNLSPFQIAEIASTLADISGLGSVGIADPLNRLRGALGLDRLTIGTNPVNPAVTPGTQQNQANTVAQAGRYVAPGVYVGAKQGIVGGNQQSEAMVQIDLTKHLKLQTGAGAGQGANNVGLTYQFQY